MPNAGHSSRLEAGPDRQSVTPIVITEEQVEEGGVGRLTLAGNDPSDFGRKPAEDFALGVDDEPFRLDVALFGEIRTHDSPEHTTKT